MHGVGENASQQALCSGRGSGSAANDCAPALLGLHLVGRFAGDDILYELANVGGCEVFDGALSNEWNNVTFDATPVGVKRGRLFGISALSEDQPAFGLSQVFPAQICDRERTSLQEPAFGRILTFKTEASVKRAFRRASSVVRTPYRPRVRRRLRSDLEHSGIE